MAKRQRDAWVLKSMVREGLSDKETFEQKPEGKEGPDHFAIWNKCILGRGSSKC